MKTEVYVSAVGMACPIGLTAEAACAAMRAGIDSRQELPYLDKHGRPIVGSALGLLFDDPKPRRRWLRLLGYALRDLDPSQGMETVRGLHMILAVPLDYEGQPWQAKDLVRGLSSVGIALDAKQVEVTATAGSCAGYQAVAMAREGFRQRRYGRCLVAGSASLIDGRILLDLAADGRLLTEDNSDGLTPGEAAACLLLQSDEHRALASIRGIGAGHEQALLSNDIPLRGDGIFAAACGALNEAGMALHDMDFRLSDATGESYHFREQMLLVARLLRQRKIEFPMWLSASTLGDVAEAAGLCGIVQAITANTRGYAPGAYAIGTVGSTRGDRAALVLELPR